MCSLIFYMFLPWAKLFSVSAFRRGTRGWGNSTNGVVVGFLSFQVPGGVVGCQKESNVQNRSYLPWCWLVDLIMAACNPYITGEVFIPYHSAQVPRFWSLKWTHLNSKIREGFKKTWGCHDFSRCCLCEVSQNKHVHQKRNSWSNLTWTSPFHLSKKMFLVILGNHIPKFPSQKTHPTWR